VSLSLICNVPALVQGPFRTPSISVVGQNSSKVYDSESARVTHYIDSENVGESPITTDKFKLRFGETETRNWGTPVKYSPQKTRNFNGQINEFTLFSKALTAKEIQSLYTTGLR